MKLAGWRKLWVFIAIVLLFFPCIFILIEMPTETRIYQNWSRDMLWKTQAETPEYQKFGVWYIRHQYVGISDRKLIQSLETHFRQIDYSTIRLKYVQQLDKLLINQGLVFAEAIFVYLLVITVLYGSAWIIARIFQGNKQSCSSQRE